MRFWEASALVPLVVDQPTSSLARQVMSEDEEMIVWWATPVECLSAIARSERSGVLSSGQAGYARIKLADLRDVWNEVSASDEVREIAGPLLLRHPLRAADALQLAAAIVWTDARPRGHGFCSLDARLSAAARGEGFAVALGPSTG